MEQVAIHKHYYITFFPGKDDVWFSLNGTTYQNNSCVTLEDIGEGGDALLCRTKHVACCIPPYTGNESALGDWFFPNGTTIPSKTVNSSSGEQWDFYRTRSRSVVHLNHRRGGVEGVYRCEMPDSNNVNQTIYIGLYTAKTRTGE